MVSPLFATPPRRRPEKYRAVEAHPELEQHNSRDREFAAPRNAPEASWEVSERGAPSKPLQDPTTNTWCGHNLDFTGATFDGGDFSGSNYSGGWVSFRRSQFSGAEVSFGDSTFSGGEVFFNGSEFSGGQVDFERLRV
ncbi:hypothetical protein ACN24M_00905 [Streptomyces microflavus]|uniref:hypothetical protein n=1 Tax=Streptomyces microflavus TaxID=1919 RepID=UPI003B21A691